MSGCAVLCSVGLMILTVMLTVCGFMGNLARNTVKDPAIRTKRFVIRCNLNILYIALGLLFFWNMLSQHKHADSAVLKAFLLFWLALGTLQLNIAISALLDGWVNQRGHEKFASATLYSALFWPTGERIYRAEQPFTYWTWVFSRLFLAFLFSTGFVVLPIVAPYLQWLKK